MKANKGFTNRAKSGDKASSARWRQAVAKGKQERGRLESKRQGSRTKKKRS